MQLPPLPPSFKPPWRNQQTRPAQTWDLAGASPAGGTILGSWRNSIRARLRNEILWVHLPPGPPNIRGCDATGRHLRLRTGVLEVRILSAAPKICPAISTVECLSHIQVMGVQLPRGVPKNLRGREDLAISAASGRDPLPLSPGTGENMLSPWIQNREKCYSKNICPCRPTGRSHDAENVGSGGSNPLAGTKLHRGVG